YRRRIFNSLERHRKAPPKGLRLTDVVALSALFLAASRLTSLTIGSGCSTITRAGRTRLSRNELRRSSKLPRDPRNLVKQFEPRGRWHAAAVIAPRAAAVQQYPPLTPKKSPPIAGPQSYAR